MPILRNGRSGNPPAPASGHTPLGVGKPNRGWLHPDDLFAQDGINYAVRVRSISRTVILDLANRRRRSSLPLSHAVHRMRGSSNVNEGPRLRHEIGHSEGMHPPRLRGRGGQSPRPEASCRPQDRRAARRKGANQRTGMMLKNFRPGFVRSSKLNVR